MRSDTNAFSQPLWYIFLRSCPIAPIEAEGLNEFFRRDSLGRCFVLYAVREVEI